MTSMEPDKEGYLKHQAEAFIAVRLASITGIDRIIRRVVDKWEPDPDINHSQGLTPADHRALDILARDAFDYTDLWSILSYIVGA